VKVWRAPYTFQTTLYLVAAAILLALAGGGIVQVWPFVRVPLEEWPVSLRSFALVCSIVLAIATAVLLLSRARRQARLRYQLDRNAVTVLQSAWRYTIPLDQILAVHQNRIPQPSAAAKPVLRFGRGGAAQTLVLETQGTWYQLALRQRDQFAHELQERRQLGVVQRQFEGLQRTENLWLAFTSSATARWLTLLVLALNLGLWSLLTWHYPSLPETIPVRFDPLGGTAGTRARTYTLLFPTAGMIIGSINMGLAVLSSRRTRLAGELLLVGAFLVQLILLAATWFVVTGTR
jgi:hypothetical protein